MLCVGCGQDDELTNNTWILIDGYHLRKKIEFKSTSPLFFRNAEDNPIRELNFRGDGTITLPGINSENIAATWKIERDSILFSIDSIKYQLHAADSRSFATDDSPLIARVKRGLEQFEGPMRIYGQAFVYEISRDTLHLYSRNVALYAVRDRRADDLMRSLRSTKRIRPKM